MDQVYSNLDSAVREDIDKNMITIIYPATVDWFLLYQRPQQLMMYFSQIENVRVIFVARELYQRLPQPIMKINDDMYVVRNDVNYSHLVKGKKVIWFSNPQQHALFDKKNYDLVVFDAIDNPVGEFISWKHDLNKAVEAADIISCT
jgi:hypothetical protein